MQCDVFRFTFSSCNKIILFVSEVEGKLRKYIHWLMRRQELRDQKRKYLSLTVNYILLRCSSEAPRHTAVTVSVCHST